MGILRAVRSETHLNQEVHLMSNANRNVRNPPSVQMPAHTSADATGGRVYRTRDGHFPEHRDGDGRADADNWFDSVASLSRLLLRLPLLMVRAVAHRFERSLLVPVRRTLRTFLGHPPSPEPGDVHMGDLRRTEPLSRYFGYDRGRPVDRYYIERFLTAWAGDVEGRVLEVAEDTYTRQFGGDRVTKSDVLHVDEGHPAATITGDLTSADHISSNAFDCIILTETLQLIYDVEAALETLRRILKPEGVLLVTVPGITPISDDIDGEAWHWSFTRHSLARLAKEHFPGASLEVESHGNVLAATAFLQGMAVEELTAKELNKYDPSYEVVITLRVKMNVPRGDGRA